MRRLSYAPPSKGFLRPSIEDGIQLLELAREVHQPSAQEPQEKRRLLDFRVASV